VVARVSYIGCLGALHVWLCDYLLLLHSRNHQIRLDPVVLWLHRHHDLYVLRSHRYHWILLVLLVCSQDLRLGQSRLNPHKNTRTHAHAHLSPSLSLLLSFSPSRSLLILRHQCLHSHPYVLGLSLRLRLINSVHRFDVTFHPQACFVSFHSLFTQPRLDQHCAKRFDSLNRSVPSTGCTHQQPAPAPPRHPLPGTQRSNTHGYRSTPVPPPWH
jgi:hypothetical protein